MVFFRSARLSVFVSISRTHFLSRTVLLARLDAVIIALLVRSLARSRAKECGAISEVRSTLVRRAEVYTFTAKRKALEGGSAKDNPTTHDYTLAQESTAL